MKDAPIINLDYAAATPVCAQALAAMQPFWAEQYYNPSAPYLPAKAVREAYEGYKHQIAMAIGAKPADLVITSGATEAINLAFTVAAEQKVGVVGASPGAASAAGQKPAPAPEQTSDPTPAPTPEQTSDPTCLYLATEHTAVRAAASRYQGAEIAVDRTGLIDLQDLERRLTPATRLISVPLADGELGVLQPVAEVARLVAAERRRRLEQGQATPLYLHTDASQALALTKLSTGRLGADLITLNSGKIYGPKGVGALYLAHGAAVQPLVLGGGQELGLRSGTENVPGVAGFAAAITAAAAHCAGHRKAAARQTQTLRQILRTAQVPPVFLGNPKHQLANFCPVSFPGLDAERLIYALEMQGVLVSTGAACAASKGQKSHTLQAIGLSEAEIAGSLRLTLGQPLTDADVRRAGQLIVQAVNREAERLGL